MITYQFLRFLNGRPSFARVTLKIADDPVEAISWAHSLSRLAKVYGDVVKDGVQDALEWHVRSGGLPSALHVFHLVISPVDTRPADVRCAVAVAAWKLLGHREDELVFKYDGEWKVCPGL